MTMMKRGYTGSFIGLLVTSNIFAAFAATCVCLVTIFLTAHPVPLILPLTVFSGTLFIYTMNRFTDRKEDAVNNPLRSRFRDRYGRATLVLAAGLYILSLGFLRIASPAAFLIAVLPPVIAILYSVFRLKRVFLIKNISVSLGILCAVLIVPGYFSDFTVFSLLLSLFFFISFLINTIVYDIKDIEGDVAYGIHTLPATVGLRKTKMVCYALLLIDVLVIPALIPFNPASSLLFLYALYIGLYITFADDPGRLPDWYYGIFVDGEFSFLCACCGVAFLVVMLW